MDRVVPVEPFAPGEYLKEELDARNWAQEDLAQVLGISRRQVANLLAGQSALTTEMAIAIGAAFGQDPKTWMELQINYELAMAKKKDDDTARRAAIYTKVPVRELKKRCWLPDVEDTNELERAICAFLRIERLQDEPRLAVAARKATDYGYQSSAEIAWYMRSRALGERISAAPYSDDNFEPGVEELLQLVKNPADVRRVPKVLADMGVRLVLLERLPKVPIDGVALWLDSSSPVVSLSLRYDRIDYFWFSLLHELVHVKHRHQSTVDTNLLEEPCSDLPEVERVANAEGSEYLIPRAKLESFIRRTKPLYYQTRVVQFAQLHGIHPGVVVGQLQHRKELTYAQLRKLLVPVREYISGQTITDGWGNNIWLGAA